MTTTSSLCRKVRRVAGLVALTGLIPLPLVAGDTATTASVPTIKASMKQIVAREVTATPVRTTVTRDDRQGANASGSPGFFRTKPGVIALAVMALGTGYAIYSAQHDRIHSPGKK